MRQWTFAERLYNTNETSSPMVSLEAMMLSCTIDAKEGRHVTVTDIPGGFLHEDMDQDIHMLLEGPIVELNIKPQPRLYRKYIWKNKNNKTNDVCQTKKGSIWHSTGSAAILETTQQYIKE